VIQAFLVGRISPINVIGHIPRNGATRVIVITDVVVAVTIMRIVPIRVLVRIPSVVRMGVSTVVVTTSSSTVTTASVSSTTMAAAVTVRMSHRQVEAQDYQKNHSNHQGDGEFSFYGIHILSPCIGVLNT
jgi:hypothetical protein